MIMRGGRSGEQLLLEVELGEVWWGAQVGPIAILRANLITLRAFSSFSEASFAHQMWSDLGIWLTNEQREGNIFSLKTIVCIRQSE